MMRIVLLASMAAAGPVGAAEIEPAALIALLERRCLTPMMAGQPADTAGLDVAEGAPSIGTPMVTTLHTPPPRGSNPH